MGTDRSYLAARLGRSLRSLREKRGLSQDDLARELKVHRTLVGGIERGERNLTLLTLERLAAKLGVDPLELLAGD